MRTIIKEPNIKKIQQRGLAIYDMHSHTTFSDGRDSVETMTKKVKELGVGLCITDHNTIGGTLQLAKQKEIQTIPGIEINTFEGPHVLCYFYNYDELQEFYDQKIKRFVKETPNIRLKKTFEETMSINNRVIIFILAPPSFLFG